MRNVFVGNFSFSATAKDVEEIFSEKGVYVDRVEMKKGFAFVVCEDSDKLEDVVVGLHGSTMDKIDRFRKLTVQFAKGGGSIQRREEARRTSIEPCGTLFVVNFDLERTTEHDLEELFREFGKIKRVTIKKNFAFVEFLAVDDAASAVDALHGKHWRGQVLTVEYVARGPSSTSGESRSGSPPRRRSSPPRRRPSSPPRHRPSSPPRRRPSSPPRRSEPPPRRPSSPLRRRSPSPRRRPDDFPRRDRERARAPRGGDREREWERERRSSYREPHVRERGYERERSRSRDRDHLRGDGQRR